MDIIKKYYGNDTVYDDCTKMEWMRLGNLYRYSYYVYKYATGLIMASATVTSMIDKKTLSTDKYLDFLSSGNNDYSLNLLSKLGIDLTDEKVISNGFDILKKDIEEFDKILNKK